MRVLGIDPGTIITGFGIVEDTGNRLSLVDYGVVKSRRNDLFPDRLKRIYEGLCVVIEKHKPDHVAVEKVFYGKSAKAAIKIGEGRGVAILCAALADVPLSEYSPTVIKKSVVGVGNAQKTQVQEMVKIILHLSKLPEPLDSSDALAIAICHCHRFKLDGLISG
ncbi:MAG: crossover junction endodeoxyribonuclease RuvC [Planctomycetes bacterium]|nr:crossover junction endodeoxyribonuclease RuvC [Planctomycetota bacterium]